MITQSRGVTRLFENEGATRGLWSGGGGLTGTQNDASPQTTVQSVISLEGLKGGGLDSDGGGGGSSPQLHPLATPLTYNNETFNLHLFCYMLPWVLLQTHRFSIIIKGSRCISWYLCLDLTFSYPYRPSTKHRRFPCDATMTSYAMREEGKLKKMNIKIVLDRRNPRKHQIFIKSVLNASLNEYVSKNNVLRIKKQFQYNLGSTTLCTAFWTTILSTSGKVTRWKIVFAKISGTDEKKNLYRCKKLRIQVIKG